MMRPILSGLFAVTAIAVIGLAPTACQSGGIGDPCVPEDEYDPNFPGFKVKEDNIESRSFQCDSRICLANFFQGRVSCPLGQAPPLPCNPADEDSCSPDLGAPKDSVCTESAANAPFCQDNARCDSFSGGEGNGKCNIEGSFCECNPDAELGAAGSCPTGYSCDKETRQCKNYVCHVPGSCQVAKGDASEGDNEGKACCVPGTDVPVAQSVCGQCNPEKNRDAPNAVYCSCRCGVAEGEPEDENFNFCECPEGFECSEIRKNLGLGDTQLTGKYCIKQGTGTEALQAQLECGTLAPGSYDDGTAEQCQGSLAQQ